MKKNSVITIVLSLIGLAAVLGAAFALLSNKHGKTAFLHFGASEAEEPELDIFDADLDALTEEYEAEAEEKQPQQTKVRRGYIPLKFHAREEA